MKEYQVKTMQKDVAGLVSETSKVPERETETKTPRHSRRLLFIILIIALGLIFGGGFYYWLSYLRVPAKMVTIEEPASLFKVDETKIIIIKQGKEKELIKELKERAKVSQFENPVLGSFQRILVRKKGQEGEYFISLREFVEIIEANIPSDVLNKLNKKYTLFFYSDREKLRLGLIAKIKEVKGLDKSLKSWEKTVKPIFKPFFLGEEVQLAESEDFQETSYNGIQLHYLNFANTSLALDYAIVKDYLVVTTSKDSMLKIIDRL